MEVASSVSAQPITLEETMSGARNRAERAFRNCGYMFCL
ncbi:DUF84 family protein [Candidatus Woesearchaeota archaeon]|nr:DUF84 family protein [Candidatus Woesearchaeota archaeon]